MYISVSDAATKFNISRRRVQFLCEQGRISGANMIDGVSVMRRSSKRFINICGQMKKMG